jgi:hypothetical protein
MNIIDFFRKKRKKIKVPIELPSENCFRCEIETPQFDGRTGKVHHMQKQTGTFYVSDIMFINDGLFSGHNVHFQSLEQLKQSLIRLL